MSDVERIAQIQARADANEGQHRGGPYWAMEALADRKTLLAALARRDAAIQAVQELRDSCLRGGQSRMFYNRALTAIAIEMEKP